VEQKTGEQQLKERRGVLLEVNAQIHDAALSSTAEATDTWEFICECGAPGCQAQAELTLAAYESLRADNEPVLAEGHSISRAARARRQAQELREDAEALRAQARHQHKRARRSN
jgi:hypothetical protein